MKHLTGLCLAAAISVPAAVSAQEVINLTIASSHPTAIPWVGMMQTHFMARTDEILAEGGRYKIEWQEAFGGTLYRANATLSSVEDGITDIGWVFSMLEGGQLPLSQVSSYTPFATNNPPVQLEVMWDLLENNPDFANEWSQYGLVVLGLTATDSYDVYSTRPINSLADLRGMKISAPGALANWLRGTGATAVDGALTTYYTDIQTGVSDGTLSLALGILPTRVYEVAPYITRVDMGTAFSGAIAINEAAWNDLPAEVQEALREAGRYYTEAHGRDLLERREFALNRMLEVGAGQNPPVTVTPLPGAEREAWVSGLPDVAGEWVAANGAAAGAFMQAYMAGLRAKGETPLRDWAAGN
ncbi:MAG TPA: C4-dicarboxylate TRAP transporter substrate-binding protein [Paracoccaceae bacterium]|nr:C4-dicarboxylate TRAP transporter substrate-binding protein [Paracoccaceae bacterium]HMO71941.1 C4-dicarboxylate TRAP transporter substrate-binding protein [Paracoccaceae bacterium]